MPNEVSETLTPERRAELMRLADRVLELASDKPNCDCPDCSTARAVVAYESALTASEARAAQAEHLLADARKAVHPLDGLTERYHKGFPRTPEGTWALNEPMVDAEWLQTVVAVIAAVRAALDTPSAAPLQTQEPT